MSANTNVTPIRKRRPAWTFADRVRRVRRDLGMTQEAFSALIGVDRQTFSAWETGRNTPDLAAIAPRLEDATGVDRLWFLGWEDENAPGPDGTEGGGADDETRTRNILLGSSIVLRPRFGAVAA